MSNEENTSLDDLQKKFYKALTWFFSERPTGFYKQLGFIKDQLEALNKNLSESSQASGRLATALNKLTCAGVIVTGFGVLLAFAHLAFEIIKYINAK